MFRSRFASAFSTKLAHLGPQDVENGVQGPVPSKEVEGLLCALLGLVLNRKKPVEYVCPHLAGGRRGGKLMEHGYERV